MKKPDLQTINAFVAYFQKWFPKTQVVPKSKSKLMSLIGFILKPFNSTFMTDFATTIGNTVYLPDAWLTDYEAQSTISVLSHEFVHIVDYNKRPIRFVLGYLFPLTLMPVFLPVLIGLSFISHWFLLGLLIFLLPWPAYWRMLIEFHGYTMSLATYYWNRAYIDDSAISWVCGNFTGGNYYFMWPFKKNLMARLNIVKANVLNKTIVNEPIFLLVQNFYIQNHLMNDNLLNSVNVIYADTYFNGRF